MSKRNRQKRYFHVKKRPGMFGLAQEAKQRFLQQEAIADPDRPAIDALFQFIHDHEYELAQAHLAGKSLESVLQELGFPLSMEEWKENHD